MNQTRRDFLKTTVAASVAGSIGIAIPAEVRARVEKWQEQDAWNWDKSVCRFCGVGCGIMMATHKGQIVSVKGDPESPVNRALVCIKGYFNAKIMCGEDRLTKPLSRARFSGDLRVGAVHDRRGLRRRKIHEGRCSLQQP